MSYHIITIDTPSCSLSCKDGQLTCHVDKETKSIPLEDVASIVINSFSASIHSTLLIEAAKHGIGLILCDAFKPASLVLPANRATDTHLTRAQVHLAKPERTRLWTRTVNAKTNNQLLLATHLAPNDSRLKKLALVANGKHPHKESETARLYWRIYSETLHSKQQFKRERHAGGLNNLLNYGYAILLSTVLQKLFAIGIDPTFGIFHATREHATPLAYDLMEPFRPCVDARVAQWIVNHPNPDAWKITPGFRSFITTFPIQKIDYLNQNLELRGVIEGVMRSFRSALSENKTTHYKPWTPKNSKWDGSW